MMMSIDEVQQQPTNNNKKTNIIRTNVNNQQQKQQDQDQQHHLVDTVIDSSINFSSATDPSSNDDDNDVDVVLPNSLIVSRRNDNNKNHTSTANNERSSNNNNNNDNNSFSSRGKTTIPDDNHNQYKENDDDVSTTTATNNTNRNSSEKDNNKKINEEEQLLYHQFILPKCVRPPQHEMEPVELFVSKAVYEQHNCIHDKDDSIPSIPEYKAIIDAFRIKNDYNMLYKLLLALRQGNALHLLISNPTTKTTNTNNTNTINANKNTAHYTKHPRLLHTIVKFCPFNIKKLIAKRTLLETGHDRNSTNSNMEDDYQVADAYFHLLIALVSANAIYLLPIVNALWNLLTDVKEFARDDTTDEIIFHPKQRTYRIHATIYKIIQLIPKASSELYPIIASCAPNRFWNITCILSYYQQCFIVTQYIPIETIRGVWKLIIDLCLSMDVEIILLDNNNTNNSILQAEDETTTTTTTTTTTQNDDQQKSNDANELNNNDNATKISSPTETSKSPPLPETTGATAVTITTENNINKEAEIINIIANKLDTLMLMLFEEIEKVVYCSSVDNNNNVNTSKNIQLENLTDLYDIIEYIFERSILITHKSKFVQFLVFYICGLEMKILQQSNNNNKKKNMVFSNNKNQATITFNKNENDDFENVPQQTLTTNNNDNVVEGTLYRAYASRLIDIVLDPYRATGTRQAGACYLASFVCRASYVCSETTCEAVAALLRWAEAYIESIECNAKNEHHAMYTVADSREQSKLHTLFYTVCQSAFYIMCFRGVEAIQFYQKIRNGFNGKSNSNNNDQAQDDTLLLQQINIGPERWSKLCSHTLQPLKYCLESVRTEFLHISKLFQLLHHDVLEQLNQEEDRRVLELCRFEQMKLQRRNSRNSLGGRRRQQSKQHRTSTKITTPSTTVLDMQRKKATSTSATLENERISGGVGGLGQGTNPLDSFFPFDPYLLRQSHVYVEPFYHHWAGTVDEEEIQALILQDDDDVIQNNVGLDDGIGDLDMEGYSNHDEEIDEDNEDDDNSQNTDGSISSSDDDSETSIQPMSYTSAHSIKPIIPLHQTYRLGESVSNSNNDDIVLSEEHDDNNTDHRAKWMAAIQRQRTPSIESGIW